jgi:hypothetical protein
MLAVIILVALQIGVLCYLRKKQQREYRGRMNVAVDDAIA